MTDCRNPASRCSASAASAAIPSRRSRVRASGDRRDKRGGRGYRASDIALHSTVGQYKVDVAAARIHDINPDCVVKTHRAFVLPENIGDFDFSQYDYVVDAIDTVSGKLALALHAQEAGVPVISSMGTGNKLDPTAFEVCDISETSFCPLARVMRTECRKRGVKKLKVVYSREEAVKPDPALVAALGEQSDVRRSIPASSAFVPSVAGLIIASEVVKDLIR